MLCLCVGMWKPEASDPHWNWSKPPALCARTRPWSSARIVPTCNCWTTCQSLLAYGKIGFHSAEQADLELVAMYLFQSSECSDYRDETPCLTFSFPFLFLFLSPDCSWTHNTLTLVSQVLDFRSGHPSQPLHLFSYLVTLPLLLSLLTCVPLKAKFLTFFKSFFPTDKNITQ